MASRPARGSSPSLAPGSRVVTEYLAAPDCSPISIRSASRPWATDARPASAIPVPFRSRFRWRSGERAGRRCSAFRQPELRSADAPAGPGELPRLTHAGRGLRAGRPRRHRPHPGASRHRDAGEPVFLREIWPRRRRFATTAASLNPRCSQSSTARSSTATSGGAHWKWLQATGLPGTPDSTYIREPPFFVDLPTSPGALSDIRRASPGVTSVTASPRITFRPRARSRRTEPAARYLIEHGVQPSDFNTFGARRGNHEVMMRGTFGNVRISNLLMPGQGRRARRFISRAAS